MSDAIKERVIRIITEVLELDEDEVENLRTEVGYKKLDKWTSIQHVEIIVALEDEFGIEIEERVIPKLNDVAKIVNYLKKRKRPA